MKSRAGFTLIEMLIVIAIVGILSSLVLVGLGPVQRQGRDARRISDLKQTQTALELYYAKKGSYPISSGGPGSWQVLTSVLTGADASIGVKSIPKDPSEPSRFYHYGSNGTSYILGAEFEDVNNPNLRDSVHMGDFGVTCGVTMYCIEF